jgi:DNA-binding NarL/FixJ family response regulator
MIRIFVVAAVRLYREGLAQLLPRDGRLEVVGTAATWSEAVAGVDAARPDVVLLDVSIPEALEGIRGLVEAADAKVVALAVAEAERDVVAYAEAGVAGYVTRDDSLDAVLAAVESVVRGETICSPWLAATLLRRVRSLASAAPSNGSRLTRRESEIAALVDQGLSNKEIAQRLCIEVATVKNHVHNILDKLQVSSRGEIARRIRVARQTPYASVVRATTEI